jgi:hypothetical protein
MPAATTRWPRPARTSAAQRGSCAEGGQHTHRMAGGQQVQRGEVAAAGIGLAASRDSRCSVPGPTCQARHLAVQAGIARGWACATKISAASTARRQRRSSVNGSACVPARAGSGPSGRKRHGPVGQAVGQFAGMPGVQRVGSADRAMEGGGAAAWHQHRQHLGQHVGAPSKAIHSLNRCGRPARRDGRRSGPARHRPAARPAALAPAAAGPHTRCGKGLQAGHRRRPAAAAPPAPSAGGCSGRRGTPGAKRPASSSRACRLMTAPPPARR